MERQTGLMLVCIDTLATPVTGRDYKLCSQTITIRLERRIRKSAGIQRRRTYLQIRPSACTWRANLRTVREKLEIQDPRQHVAATWEHGWAKVSNTLPAQYELTRYTVIDSVEETGALWIRSAGFEEAWKE